MKGNVAPLHCSQGGFVLYLKVRIKGQLNQYVMFRMIIQKVAVKWEEKKM